MTKKTTSSAAGSTGESLNTEQKPTLVVEELPPSCPLCKWFDKRLNNTLREQIKHMEKYHVS